jgi:hypothetical protein
LCLEKSRSAAFFRRTLPDLGTLRNVLDLTPRGVEVVLAAARHPDPARVAEAVADWSAEQPGGPVRPAQRLTGGLSCRISRGI